MKRRPIQPDIFTIWAALFLALVLFWVSVFAAFAGDTYRWNGDTYVYLTPSERPGVVAEVLFRNSEIHSGPSTFELEIDGLTVTVTVTPDRAYGQPDLLTVEPPPGFMAVPPELWVPEDGGGRIDIVAMGMM